MSVVFILGSKAVYGQPIKPMTDDNQTVIIVTGVGAISVK